MYFLEIKPTLYVDFHAYVTQFNKKMGPYVKPVELYSGENVKEIVRRMNAFLIEMAGGNGKLAWVAPDQGSFDDLALRGDSPTTHLWAGQANLTLEGVFFTPFAQAEYAGTAGQNQVRAQFVAKSLHARGQGTLVVAPEAGRSVDFPRAESALIR